MKPHFSILAILAIAVTIGFWQNSRFQQLKQHAESLESRVAHPVAVRRVRLMESAASPQPASQAELDALFEEFVTEFLDRKNGNRSDAPDDDERRRNWLLTAAKSSAGDIERFLQKLRNDPRLAGLLDKRESIYFCLQVFAEMAPSAAMQFIEAHRDLPEWNNYFAGCFSQYLRANPIEAIRWFDAQTALGNPDIANSNVRKSILIRESRIDPDKMLARAMTPDFASDPETLSRLGGFVASTLKQPAEHLQFLAALRRMQNASDPAPQLLKIRAEYIAGLSQTLADFRFEDTSVLVDTEFTLDEKLNLISTLSQRGDLSDPAKWADWLLKIDPSTWDKWIATQGTKIRYPVTELISNWSRQDNVAAGQWLEKLADSPLKADLTKEYVLCIARIDPDRASNFLPQLPEGESKDKLIRQIDEVRDYYSSGEQTRAAERIRPKFRK